MRGIANFAAHNRRRRAIPEHPRMCIGDFKETIPGVLWLPVA